MEPEPEKKEANKALIIGFTIYFTGMCMGTGICTGIFSHRHEALCEINYTTNNNTKPNSDAFMELKTYLVVAFYATIITSVISLSGLIGKRFCPLDKKETFAKLTNTIFMLLNGTFTFIWIIVGAVLYSNLGTQCHQTSTGKWLLAYCIICWFYAPCFICFGIMSIVFDSNGKQKDINNNKYKEMVNDPE